MKRTVEEYMGLPYTIELTPDEGSYFVKVKELKGCISVGATKAEALEMIEDAMQEWIAAAIDDDIDVPLPMSSTDTRYSGKFPLRLPKSMHRDLAQGAEEDGVSLNQFIVMLLSEKHAIHKVKKMLSALEDPSCEEPEVDPVITFTADSRKILPFHRNLKVVGGN